MSKAVQSDLHTAPVLDEEVDLRLRLDEGPAARGPAEPRPGADRPGIAARVGGVVRTARPRQWAKNLLVFAAPAAAGVLDEVGALTATSVAFLAFCLAASSTYCLNDLLDREADRHHPDKRHRPVAAGLVPPGLAGAVAVSLAVAAVALALIAAGPALAALVGAYLVLTTSYSLWLKHMAIIDIAAISAGFVLRAAAGAVAVDVPMSDWFLIVVSFAALFVAAGKRLAEQAGQAGPAAADGEPQRVTLAVYTTPFLRHVALTATSVTITAYCLWALDTGSPGGNPWMMASIAPFALALLRYGLLVHQGQGEAPEEILLGDRPMRLTGAAWGLLFLVGVYAV